MLCLYWCMVGPLYWELLESDETFNSDVYCRHMDNVQAVLDQMEANGEWEGPVKLLQDNAKPHRSRRSTHHVKEMLGWEVLDHPPYSPDVAPSDYHIFLSLKNFMRGRQFKNRDQVEASLREYFEFKEPEFYARGIRKLPKRWLTVHYNRGEYLIS
uniref:Transposase n=1 Tax=Acrobeloides nanus TaxID=290746 RepID=A0A914DGL5_9BILA